MSITCMLIAVALGADAPLPFRADTIDSKVGIGYGLAVADVDGDKKPDLLLVDKAEVAWYQNPSWQKRLLVGKLTSRDHVCIAARDIDGDGKAEVAVGADWDPGDTLKSGSIHYLVPPADRTARWEPVALPNEPTVHRMRWVRGPAKSWYLIVAPLHGRGNRGGQGDGVKVLAYRKPDEVRGGAVGGAWPTELLDDSLHVLHNLDVLNWDEDPEEEVLLAGKEGVFLLDRGPERWAKVQIAGNRPGATEFEGAGEIRTGRLPGGKRFLVTVEPFHGNRVVAYTPPAGAESTALWDRHQLDDTLSEGHALACANFLGLEGDQIAAGWRKMDKNGKVGVRIYLPLDGDGKRWERVVLDDNTMACEDLQALDLNGDGMPDLVAAGRDTHNLKVYFSVPGSAKSGKAPGGQ